MQLLTTSYFPPPGSLSSTISLEPVLLEESEALFLPLSLENRSGNLQTAHDVQHNLSRSMTILNFRDDAICVIQFLK